MANESIAPRPPRWAAAAPFVRASLLGVALAFGCASHCVAQMNANEAKLSSGLVKTGLYLIEGGGCNSLLRFSANGMILVDGKSPGQYRALMTQVRKISRLADLPLRVLVLTGPQESSAGNNVQFRAAGLALVAQENAKKYLRAQPPPGETAAAAPSFTFDREYTLRLGGVEARLEHAGASRTDAQTLVLFPDLKVVALGELYTRETPQPDYAAGGSLVGWARSLDRLMQLDFDTAVPCTGQPLSRSEVEVARARLATLIAAAAKAVREGTSKEGFAERLRAGGAPHDLRPEDIDHLYDELARQP